MITLAELEQQKSELLLGLTSWPASQLSFQSSPDQWSAINIVDHLGRTESAILAATRQGVTHPHTVSIRDKLGAAFIERIFRSDRRVKVPKGVTAILPDPSASLPAVVTQWDAVRRDLKAFLDEVTPEQCKEGVFRHPIGGWMTLPQVLTFFSVHILHHRYQLNRTEKSLLAVVSNR